MADEIVPLQAGQRQESRVHLDVAEVRQPGDNGGCGIGVEGPFKALLGIEAFRLVVDDENEAVWPTRRIRKDKRSDLMHPLPLVACASDLDHNLAERLPHHQPFYRVVSNGEFVIVAVGELEPLTVFRDRSAQVGKVLNAVQRQGHWIGPGEGLIRIY